MGDTHPEQMNSYISHDLDDMVFFYARKVIEGSSSWQIHVDSAACLVSLRPNENGLPTVDELRKADLPRKIENDKTIYEGRVLFSAGIIIGINDKLLMLFRNKDAPVDPLKWTSPAGRCDREPLLTAFKEFYEEIILFDHISGRPIFVVFPDNPYADEAIKCYGATLARKGFRHPPSEWICLDAQFANNYDTYLQDVFTFFRPDGVTDTTEKAFIGRFFPFFDLNSNTLELRLLASLSVSSEAEASLAFCDGEYDRPVKLFDAKELLQIEGSCLVRSMDYFRDKVLRTGTASF